jgi:hypothetical protein
METLNRSPNVCLAVDPDINIFYVNRSYFEFANKNGGDKIEDDFGRGSNLLEAISGDQKDFYREFFNKCMGGTSMDTFEYECSSPEEFRLFKMFVYPLRDNNGLLMEHALIVEKEHDRPEAPYDKRYYIDENGILHQCGHCRRVRHLTEKRWDWCPTLMGFENTSHGICDICLDFYYPDL